MNREFDLVGRARMTEDAIGRGARRGERKREGEAGSCQSGCRK
jgi:hypothetical protein